MNKSNSNESNGSFNVGERQLTERLFKALSSRLNKTKDEEIINSHMEKVDGRVYMFDLYFPKGISNLDIPEKSAIELKLNLLTNSICRFNEVAKSWKKENPSAKLILLYNEGSLFNNKVPDGIDFEIEELSKYLEHLDNIEPLNDSVEQKERTWQEERKEIIRRAKLSFNTNRITLFLGAGVSQDAGGPSWNELLYKSAKELGAIRCDCDFDLINKACSNSSIIMGRYIVPDDKKGTFTEYLHDNILYKNVKIDESALINEICEIVSRKSVESIITYNYDNLMEQALARKGVQVQQIFKKDRTTKDTIPVYHIHGYIPQHIISDKPGSCFSTPVISEKQYHEIYREAYHWSNVEQLHALDRNVCVFIGLSMTDPNLRRLLDISQNEADNSHHFAFLKREKSYMCPKGESFNNSLLKNIENQLDDMGVSVIWFEEYKEVPELLKEICKEIK